jgi:hypothetical protein
MKQLKELVEPQLRAARGPWTQDTSVTHGSVCDGKQLPGYRH